MVFVTHHCLTKLDKPVNYLGWILQTNAQGLAVSGAWGDLPGSQAARQWTIPITNSALPLQFFRLRQP